MLTAGVTPMLMLRYPARGWMEVDGSVRGDHAGWGSRRPAQAPWDLAMYRSMYEWPP